MPRCPNCGHTYEGAPDNCPECHEEIAPDSPIDPSSEGDRGDRSGYVPLLTLSDPGEAMVLRATLDEAGIPVIMETRGPITADLAVVADDITDDYAVLLVPPDRLDEARQLIESLRREPPQWPPGMEPEEGEEEAR